MARNNINPDPEKDRHGCYKRGFPVVVQPDGHEWGLEESKQAWLAAGRAEAGWPGHFVIVKIPGVTVAQVERVIEPQAEDDSGVPTLEEDGITSRIFRRRRWRVLVDDIPAAIRNQLLTNGEITVTPTQVRNYVKRIRDNMTFDGL